jgi:hypothetical protein
MSKKNFIILSVALAAVVALYFYLYKDSFSRATIQISHTIRPRGSFFTRRAQNAPADADMNLVMFRLEHAHKLTCIKVIPIPELETNKYAHPIWDIVSDSNSVPVQAFSYGTRIRGMHPTVKGATPDPLLPNVPYRLFVEAGPIKGEHDFTITEANHLAQ